MKKGHPIDDRNPTQELVLIYFFGLDNLKKMSNGHSLQEIQQGVGYQVGDSADTPTSSQEVAFGSHSLFEDEWNGESMEWTSTQENVYLMSSLILSHSLSLVIFFL